MLWLSENEQRDFFKKRNAKIIVTNKHVKSLQWFYIEALTSKVATNFDLVLFFLYVLPFT